MKKRIKTRRLTNIYHSDDDDVGDGYNLLSPPLFLFLFLSLSVPLPLPKTVVSCANFFEHGILACFFYWLQPKARFR